MVQDMAGIPLGSRCTIFSSEDIDRKLGSNHALIELDAEIANGGKLLLLRWGGEDPLDFELYPLRAPITKEAATTKLLQKESLVLLCEEKSWSLDPLSFGQLAAWVQRENPEERETLIDFKTSSNRHV